MTCDPLPAFPAMSCQPRILKFCSRFARTYDSRGCVSRMHATRFSFATLLAQLDVSQIEGLEIGAEALSLPIAAAYTWTSLRELVITGYWMHPHDDPGAFQDPRSRTPASIHAHVHIGTLLVAAPRLLILRIHCRYNTSSPHPYCVVWPGDDSTTHQGTGIRTLDTFELYNPTAMDGVYAQLPPTLRTLSLLSQPHCTSRTTESRFTTTLRANETDFARGVLTPAALMRMLSATALPDLRDLRLSFRDLTDMRLCEFIADSFPRLEFLELHAEAGAQVLWRAPELSACARALVPLVHLQNLRLNTFRSALSVERWQWVQRRDPDESPEQRAREGIALPDIISALFGRHEGDSTDGRGGGTIESTEDTSAGEMHGDMCRRWPALREIWLPQTVTHVGRYNMSTSHREWGVYSVHRNGDGSMGLHKSGSNVPIEEDDASRSQKAFGPSGTEFIAYASYA